MISQSESRFSWRLVGTIISFDMKSMPMSTLAERVKAKIAGADETQLNEIESDWNNIVSQYQTRVPGYYSKYARDKVLAAIESQRDKLAAIAKATEKEVEKIKRVEPNDYIVSPTLIPNGVSVAVPTMGMSTTTLVLVGAGVLGAILLIRKFKKGR